MVGLGSWGRRLLPPVADRFDVVALASAGSAATRDWCARRHPGTPHFTGLDAALAVPDLDAVFLATPTGTHADLTRRALVAGWLVFVEKPLAVQPASAFRVVTLGVATGSRFTEYVHLFHPALKFLRSVAAPREIRSLRSGWWRSALAGPIHEKLLGHDLAVTIALTGEVPRRVRVLASTDRRFSA